MGNDCQFLPDKYFSGDIAANDSPATAQALSDQQTTGANSNNENFGLW